MKKLFLLLISMCLTSMLGGCSKEKGFFETLSSKGYANRGSCISDTQYLGLFEKDSDHVLLVLAPMTSQQVEAINELDIFDDHYGEQFDSIINSLKEAQMIDLTPYTPTQEELNRLVDKTLRQIYEEGYIGEDYSVTGLYASIMLHRQIDDFECGIDVQIDLDYAPVDNDFEEFNIGDHLDDKCTNALFIGFNIIAL